MRGAHTHTESLDSNPGSHGGDLTIIPLSYPAMAFPFIVLHRYLAVLFCEPQRPKPEVCYGPVGARKKKAWFTKNSHDTPYRASLYMGRFHYSISLWECSSEIAQGVKRLRSSHDSQPHGFNEQNG